MISTQAPRTLDDGTEELARQLSALRWRSRRVAREVRRIHAELIDLIKLIDAHNSQDGAP